VTVVALVLYVVALVVLFAVRSWLQQRRTGWVNAQVIAVGPVGIEPTTRGLKVRCSAS
jgi:hypothetical protein